MNRFAKYIFYFLLSLCLWGNEKIQQIPTAQEINGQVLWFNQGQGQYLPVVRLWFP